MGFFFQSVPPVGGGPVDESINSVTSGLEGALSKLGKAFSDNIDADKIKQMVDDVDKSASQIARYFGQGSEHVQNIRVGLSDSIVKINKLGGDLNNIVSIQEGAAQVLGRNVVIAGEEYEKLFATQQVVGQSSSTIVDSFKNVGISMYQSSKEMEKVVSRAREIGVSAQAVSSQVVNNMDMMNKYTFKGGVDGLAKMAAQAINLRINVNDIGQTLDKAFNPESAIEMAASLQRLGVAQSDLLDPLRLMDLAQNDPAELQNQIAEMSKQFVQLNEKGQFEIMPGAKRQLNEIAGAMGMSVGALSKMALGSAELDDKMSKIRFPDTFTEEQKTMIANMAEMGEGGEYKMTLDGKSLNLEEGMQEILSKSKEEQEAFFSAQQPKTMEELARDQLSASQTMAATLTSIANKLPAAISGAKATGQLTGTIKKGSQKFADSFDDELLNVTTIRGKLNELTSDLSKGFEDGKINFDELSASVTKFGTYMDEIALKKLTEGSEVLGGVFKYFKLPEKKDEEQKKEEQKKEEPISKHTQASDFLKMPGQTVEFLPQDSFMAMTKGPEFLERVSSLGKTGQNTTSTYNENKNTHDITLTVKIDAGNMSEDKILAVLNRTETLQSLNKKLKETMNSNGLMV